MNGPCRFPLENLKVILRDGSYHPVDSIPLRNSREQAFRNTPGNATGVAGTYHGDLVITPEVYVGDVVSDFNRRRGKVEGMNRKQVQAVKAKYLAEKFGYTVLRTLIPEEQSTMEFSHYEEVPAEIAKRIVEITKGKFF